MSTSNTTGLTAREAKILEKHNTAIERRKELYEMARPSSQIGDHISDNELAFWATLMEYVGPKSRMDDITMLLNFDQVRHSSRWSTSW